MLADIVAHKRKQIRQEQLQQPLDEVIKLLEQAEPVRNFFQSLSSPSGLAVIGEIKKASPSKGIIRETFDPVEIAGIYTDCGIEAISVLTEEEFFQGHISYLRKVRQFTPLPLLRKDFIIDPYQVYQSRVYGADAILLIAQILDEAELGYLLKLTVELGMNALVEVHSEAEIEKAVSAGARIIGINNRDLNTFSTSLETTERLIETIPKKVLVVSESGIQKREDMIFLETLGIKAVLVGEAFMKAPSIKEKVLALKGCGGRDGY